MAPCWLVAGGHGPGGSPDAKQKTCSFIAGVVTNSPFNGKASARPAVRGHHLHSGGGSLRSLTIVLTPPPPPPPATVGGGDGGRRRILEMRRRWRGRTAEHMAVRMSVKNHTPPLQTVGVLLAMHSLVSGSFPASIGCNSQVECGAGQASGRILPRISVYAHLPRTTGKLYQRIKIAPNVGRRWQTRQVNRWSKTSGDTTVSST